MMAADAFGNAADAAENAAIGLEMFHNFTLLHDDVMDESPLRRGRATVHSKWDVNTAILSGDTMLTLATQLIAKVEDSKLRTVLEAFNEMALRVYEGQRLDMDFENRKSVTTAEYIRMIGDKTGALLGAACMIGAVIGGATEEDAAHMYEFGMMLGLAFQVQDDWLDTYGDANTFGKPIGGDINNGKKTYLLVSGLERNDADSKALSEAMALPAGDLRVKVVRNIYDRMGLSEDCRKEVAEYSAKAMAALKATSLDEERREPFRKIVEKLTGRRK
jgi:geranylgeranyl diphosphate synthase type II